MHTHRERSSRDNREKRIVLVVFITALCVHSSEHGTRALRRRKNEPKERMSECACEIDLVSVASSSFLCDNSKTNNYSVRFSFSLHANANIGTRVFNCYCTFKCPCKCVCIRYKWPDTATNRTERWRIYLLMRKNADTQTHTWTLLKRQNISVLVGQPMQFISS